MLLIAAILMGCKKRAQPSTEISTTVPPLHKQEIVQSVTNKRWTMDQIRWVTLSPPLPSDQVSQPLFPDLDKAQIEQLLQWIDESEPDADPKLTIPKRSDVLHIGLKSGESIDVSPAWTCTYTTETNGNQSTHCTTVKDRVTIYPSATSHYYAKSPELYQFLSTKHFVWMPKVPLFLHPESLRLGEPFTVSGNGWVDETVSLEIKHNNQVIWTTKIATDHGRFSTTGIISKNLELPAKDLSLSVRSGTRGSLGITVQINTK